MKKTLFALGLLLYFFLSFAAASTPPACGYQDIPAENVGYDAWPYTLLDTLYKLPPDYAPTDLVSVLEAGFDRSDLELRAVVMDDLKALKTAADSAGMALELQSAYRSYSYQEQTFSYWVAEDGEAAALKTSARPGHSEHQLGTGMDFKTAGGPDAWDVEDWAVTPEGAWLQANAATYGFVMSYPKGQEALTCYSYEPWHYRYVGRNAAAAIAASGLTLREWLWQQASP